MFNISKVKSLAKEKGLKIGFLCKQIGMEDTYIYDCSRGKNRMTDDRLAKIAEILGTSVAYLNDETDDPAPIPGEPIPQSELEVLRDMATDLLKKLDEPDLKAVFAFLQAKNQQ